jgi:TonB family protein
MGRSLSLLAALVLATLAQGQEQQIVWPKHVKAPIYPAIAQTAHVAGVVIVRVTLDSEGRVTKADVVSGSALLQRAAVDSVRLWTFTKPPYDDFSEQVSCVFRLLDPDKNEPTGAVEFDFPDRVTVTAPLAHVMTNETAR